MDIKEFQIERFYALHEFVVPYMLSGSDIESMSIAELLKMDGRFEQNLEWFISTKLTYTETKGDPELRELLGGLYEEVSGDDILVYSGAEEGIFGFMAGVLKEGDHLIVQFPCYQSLYEIAKANGVRVSKWLIHEGEGWKPNFARLKELITEGTRAVMINSPNNPTGYNFTLEEQKQIIRICEENEILLFSDEVYRFSEHDEQKRLPAAADLSELGISLGVLSKSFGLPGLRIGWIATRNREIMKRLEIFKDYTTLCNSAPSEKLAILALKNWNEIIRRNRKLILSNLKILKDFLSRNQDLFAWIEPEAGCIGFLRTKFTDDAEGFCSDVLKKSGVLLLPGTKYLYMNKYFRIGFGRKDFKEGLHQLERYITNFLRKDLPC